MRSLAHDLGIALGHVRTPRRAASRGCRPLHAGEAHTAWHDIEAAAGAGHARIAAVAPGDWAGHASSACLWRSPDLVRFGHGQTVALPRFMASCSANRRGAGSQTDQLAQAIAPDGFLGRHHSLLGAGGDGARRFRVAGGQVACAVTAQLAQCTRRCRADDGRSPPQPAPRWPATTRSGSVNIADSTSAMQTYHRHLYSPADRSHASCTIGNFDGVHRGHQALLKHRDGDGPRTSPRRRHGLVTFEPASAESAAARTAAGPAHHAAGAPANRSRTWASTSASFSPSRPNSPPWTPSTFSRY